MTAISAVTQNREEGNRMDLTMPAPTRIEDLRFDSDSQQPVCFDLASTGWLDAGTVAQLRAHFAREGGPEDPDWRDGIVVRDERPGPSRNGHGGEVLPTLAAARTEQSQLAQAMRDHVRRIACCRRARRVVGGCRFIGARL